jgi:hypothetical protein
MKMPPDLIKAMEKMQPGKIVKSGFLGDDLRPLTDIIQHDEEVMQKIGLDYETIAVKMKYLMDQGLRGLGEPITVDGKWIVRIDEARGKLPCPFGDGMFKKINANVKSIKYNKSINFSELSLHLIEKHHFFQGKGSFYRLEPEIIEDIFEL